MTTKNLIIIDLQYDFLYFRNGEINKKLLKIDKYLRDNQEKISNEYENIIQIIDNLDGEYTENIYLNNYELLKDFDHNGLSTTLNGIMIKEEDYFTEKEEDLLKEHYIDILTNVIYKEYGYFRNIMDNIEGNESEEQILNMLIKLIPYMIEDNIYNSSELNINIIDKMNLSENEKIEYIDLFIDGENLDIYEFSIPEKFVKEIISKLPDCDIQIDLIGGGITACLKEVHILLKGLGYNNINILTDLTY